MSIHSFLLREQLKNNTNKEKILDNKISKGGGGGGKMLLIGGKENNFISDFA